MSMIGSALSGLKSDAVEVRKGSARLLPTPSMNSSAQMYQDSSARMSQDGFPRQEYRNVPREACRSVPGLVQRRECKTVQSKECTVVPGQSWQSVQGRRCYSVSRERCNTVPRQKCRSVPRQACRSNPKQVQGQECQNINNQECALVPGQECQSVPREQCSTISCEQCRSVPEQKCTSATEAAICPTEPASVVLFHIEERVSKVKHLHFVSGVKPPTYWTAAFLWDLTMYTMSTILGIFIFLMFDAKAYVSKGNLGPLVMLMLLYGWSSVPLMYPTSFSFFMPSSAFVTLACANLFIGIITTITPLVLEGFDD